jgi:hypothetical protein
MVNSAFDLMGLIPVVKFMNAFLRVFCNPLCFPHDRGRAESLAQREEDAKCSAKTEGRFDQAEEWLDEAELLPGRTWDARNESAFTRDAAFAQRRATPTSG